MQRLAILATTLLAAATTHAQAKPSAAIPSTQPTYSVSDLPSARASAPSPAAGGTNITWNGAQLTIDASGEPLPEVLGRIARQTGMKITGGVPDEHIFGTYGPATVQVVLGQLFEGLTINMMLVNESPTKPKELILTARTGGPTPPSTRQVEDTSPSERSSEPIEPIAPLSGARPLLPAGRSPRNTYAAPPAAGDLPAAPADDTSAGNAGAANGNPATDTNNTNSDADQPQSPNGVKTPEQIFEELRKRAASGQTQ